MLRKREDETLNARQVGTTEESAIAMLDPLAERRLYRLYQDFFRAAEDERHWNVWNDIPWDEAGGEQASDALTAAVLAQYRDLLFLPDYAGQTLARLRSSRGRGWFLTRWSYDEGRHLLALHEWLVRRGGQSEDALKEMADHLLETSRWVLPYPNVAAVMTDALVWEMAEMEQLAHIRDLAVAEGDVALLRVADHVLADEAAHREFLRDALCVVAQADPREVEEALQQVGRTHEAPRLADALRAYLGLSLPQ